MRSTPLLVLFATGVVVSCASAPPPAPPAPSAAPPQQVVSAKVYTPPALRLPKSVRPQSYAITMRMSPKEEKFDGKVDVDIDVREATDVIWLHAAENLTVKGAKIAGAAFVSASPTVKIHHPTPNTNASSAAPASVDAPNKTDKGEDIVGLTFDEPLRPGVYKVTLDYDGKLPSRDGKGAYRQEDRGDWYIFTQFEASSARHAFPCFDEPGFKTPYQITLEVPKDQLAFANTPQTGEATAADGWKKVTFAPSKPLPSYLVAFAVGPFEIVDAGKAGEKQVPVRIIVPKGRTAEAAYAAQTTGQVVERLEKYFGIPYPYEKVDHIAVPQKGGAMENPGLITYGTGTILGKPEDKSIRLQRGYLGIASHELGHIWFGDYVTTEWWDDIWLNEAFATWISAKIVDQWHPEWDGLVSKVQSKNGVMGSDSLVSTRRIRQPIESKHDIANAFDGITYQKGGAVITMFESFVGEEPFRKAVHGYLEKHAHGNATAAEFLKDMGEALQKDSTVDKSRAEVFSTAFATFLDQPGIPFITAELSCEKDKTPKLVLSQQRYLPQGSTGSADQTWKVPVCASYPGGKSCTVLTSASGELPLTETKTCPAWVNPNANAAGYYRVAYKGDLLARLLKNGGKVLPIHERIGVLGDALALVRNGHLQEGDVLTHVPGLVQEGNRHLIGMTISLVGGLSDHLVPDDLRPNYKRFIAKTYTARAKQLGWKPKDTEDDSTRLLRGGLVALVAKEDDAALAADARKLTEAWLTDKSAIDHDLVGTVTHAGSRGADRALWDKLHAAAKGTQDRKERGNLLGAMAAARDPKLIEENFKVALSDEFDPRESSTLIWGATGDPKTRQMAYDFVKTNYDKLVGRLPKDAGASFASVASGFCDAEHRADAEAFFKDRTPKLSGGPRLLAQTLESMALCIAQKPTRRTSVGVFLKKY